MKYMVFTLVPVLLVVVFAFGKKGAAGSTNKEKIITTASNIQSPLTDSIEKNQADKAADFVAYAKTLIGTPYVYGSMEPSKGLDCSGFVNAVSNHLGIKLPRSSVEFTGVGTDVDVAHAMPGDIILFTGTDPGSDKVGHVGIVTCNPAGDVEFIHSSSGKANGVTISKLRGYYETRFVKVIRIFQAETSRAIV